MTSRLAKLTRRLTLSAGAAAMVVAAPLSSARAAGGPQVIEDTEINETLHKECDGVFAAAGLDGKNLKIFIIQDRMNAFTMSGQAMGITTELIEKTETPNQLIGVMAHESGHAAAGHPTTRSGEMQAAGLNPMILTLGLGILAALAGAPDAAAAMLSSSSYFSALGSIGYSREQEARADQAAITYLEKSGQSGRGVVDFFDNFRYEEVFQQSRRFPFFQDHPITSDRIELLRRRAEEQPHYNTPDSAEIIARHEIMKAKLFAFIEPPQQTFITYSETDRSFVARYARAIAYYRSTEPEKALIALDGLLTDYPDNPYLWELKGQVLFESGRAKLAEEAHSQAVRLKPAAPLLQVNLAQAILAQEDGKRADEAIAHLQRALVSDHDNVFAWRLMAQAYDAKGDGGNARLASAEANFSTGDFVQARVFALRARELLKRNSPEWRRATDIVLVSKPGADDLKALQRQASGPMLN